MRRTLGLIAVLAALGSAPAALAQDDPQQLQQQQDRQQRDVEQYRAPAENAFLPQQRAMADEARRRAAAAKTPEAKDRWLKAASNWDVSRQAEPSRLQADR